MQIKCTCGHSDDWSRFKMESYLANIWQCPCCGRLFTLRGVTVNTIINTWSGTVSASEDNYDPGNLSIQ